MLKAILTSLVSAVGCIVLVSPVQAATTTLSNNNGATATYTDDGFTRWTIGAKDILAESAIYYGVGSTTGETRLNPSALTQTSTNTANGTFDGGDFTIALDLLLSDTDSQLSQTITITNTSTSALDFKLFKYFDLTTSNSTIEDTASVDGTTFTATQSGDIDTITTTVSATPNAAEVDAIDFTDDILDRLDDEIATTLNNSKLGPIGPDDMTYAYEWNLNLAADESFTVRFDSRSSLSTPTPVPFEFSPSFGLVLLMLAFAGKRSYKYWQMRFHLVKGKVN